MSKENGAGCPALNPSHPGEVVDAPHYIRVRPSWIERWLLVAVLVQILMGALFILYGSQPARDIVERQKINAHILCDVLKVNDPVVHEKYVRWGYCEVGDPR